MGLVNRLYLTCAVFSLVSCAHAFYLPGAAPHDYHEGDEVNLLVNALTPMLAGSGNAKIVRLPTLGAHLAVLTLLGDRNP